ncbi:5-methylcytosine restriction system specificity protein McrC [Mycetocola saprophilus]|uniref:5-methylcytosine restriction system specificity protein McrC n=1 Tax=Mycetocola saprophilus TaxID=76636 RepID=UPI003BF407E4
MGITVLNAGNFEGNLVIHILPKMWRPNISEEPQWVLAPEADGEIFIFEKDYVGFPTAISGQSRVNLEEVADTDPELFYALEAPDPADAMWRAVSAPGAKVVVSNTSEFPGAAAKLLWNLLDDYGIRPTAARGTKLPTLSGAPMMAGLDGVKELTQQFFVAQAERYVNRRKQIFQQRTEAVATVRGQITSTALINRRISGSSVIECTFDDLGEDMLLWSTVKYALEKCRDELEGDHADIERSIAALQHLKHLPVSEVKTQGSRWRGRSQTHDLRQLHGLALAILDDTYAAAMQASDEAGVLVNLKYVTSALWEKVLERAFRAASCEVETQSPLNLFYEKEDGGNRWEALSHPKKPDLFVNPRDTEAPAFIADAKYMLGSKVRDTGKSDQYQIASYAMRTGRTTLMCFAGAPDCGNPELKVLAIPRNSVDKNASKLPGHRDVLAYIGAVRLPFPSFHHSTVHAAEKDLHEAVKILVSDLAQL